MSSFSDAHECPEIPVIAANLHRAVLPRQSQIWAVLHPEQTLQRVHYQMASTFLGRCCLSGGVDRLSGGSGRRWNRALRFTTGPRRSLTRASAAAAAMSRAATLRAGSMWRAQALRGGGAALVVLHSFAGAPETVSVPLQGNMKIEELYAREGIAAKVEKRQPDGQRPEGF